jgi:hypothetical protein
MSIRQGEAVASALPHSDLTAWDMAVRHFETEPQNNVDLIVPTVSAWDQQFVTLNDHWWEGKANPSLHLTTFTTPEAVREHYVDVKTRTYNELNEEVRRYGLFEPWYLFFHSDTSFFFAEDNRRIPYRAAFLVPTWDDGIIGEIAYMVDPTKTDFFEDLGEKVASPLFVAPGALVAKLNECDEAWRAGDVEKRLAHFADETRSAIGIAEANGPGRSKFVASTKQELHHAWSSPQVGRVLELERVHTLVSTFYVFAHYRLRVDTGDRIVVRETASLLPVNRQRDFIGELSYSLEVGVDQ